MARLPASGGDDSTSSSEDSSTDSTTSTQTDPDTSGYIDAPEEESDSTDTSDSIDDTAPGTPGSGGAVDAPETDYPEQDDTTDSGGDTPTATPGEGGEVDAPESGDDFESGEQTTTPESGGTVDAPGTDTETRDRGGDSRDDPQGPQREDFESTEEFVEQRTERAFDSVNEGEIFATRDGNRIEARFTERGARTVVAEYAGPGVNMDDIQLDGDPVGGFTIDDIAGALEEEQENLLGDLEQYEDEQANLREDIIDELQVEAGMEARTDFEADAEAMSQAQDVTETVFTGESPDREVPEGQVATGEEAMQSVTGESTQPAPEDLNVSVDASQPQPVGQSTVAADLDQSEGGGQQGPVENLLSASRDASHILTQGVVMPTAAGAGEVADVTTDVITIPTDVATGQGVEVDMEGSGVAEDFTEDTVIGVGQVGTSLSVGAPLTAQAVGEAGIDAGQFAVRNPSEVPEATVDVATDYVESTVETARHRPGLLVGQFAAGAGIGGAAARGVAGTRLMTGRTGQAISTVSRYDPGANLIRLGRRGVIGVRSRVGGGSGSGAGVVSRTPPGTGGTGSLFDADAVDAARGITGPSRRARIRGRIERSDVATQIRSYRDDVQAFLADTRAQQNLLGRGESRRGSDDGPQTDVDVDESDVPTDYDPSDSDLGVPDDDPFRVSDQRLYDQSRSFDEPNDPSVDVDPTDRSGVAEEDIGTGIAGRGNPQAAPGTDFEWTVYRGQTELTDIQSDLRSMAQREGRGGRAEPIVEDPVGVADDSAVFPRERPVSAGDAAVDAADLIDGAAADAAAVTGAPAASGGLAVLMEAQRPQVTAEATTPDGVVETAQTPTLDIDTRNALASAVLGDMGASDAVERIDAAERSTVVEDVNTDVVDDVTVDSGSDIDVDTSIDTDADSDTDTGVDVTVGPDTGTDTDTTPDQTTGTETTPGETTTPVQEPGTPGDTDMPPADPAPPTTPGGPRVPGDPDGPLAPPGRPPGRPEQTPPRRPRPRPDLPEDNEDAYPGVRSVDLDLDEKTFEYDVASPSEVADGLYDDTNLDDDTDLDIDAGTDIDLDLDV